MHRTIGTNHTRIAGNCVKTCLASHSCFLVGAKPISLDQKFSLMRGRQRGIETGGRGGFWSAFRFSLVHSMGAFQRPFTFWLQMKIVFTGLANASKTYMVGIVQHIFFAWNLSLFQLWWLLRSTICIVLVDLIGFPDSLCLQQWGKLKVGPLNLR